MEQIILKRHFLKFYGSLSLFLLVAIGLGTALFVEFVHGFEEGDWTIKTVLGLPGSILCGFVIFYTPRKYKVIRAMFGSKLLTWIHVIMTISAVFLLLYSLFFGTDVFSSTPKRYIDLNGWNHFSNLNGNLQLAVYSTFVLVIAQAAFVVNLVAGILKRVM